MISLHHTTHSFSVSWWFCLSFPAFHVRLHESWRLQLQVPGAVWKCKMTDMRPLSSQTVERMLENPPWGKSGRKRERRGGDRRERPLRMRRGGSWWVFVYIRRQALPFWKLSACNPSCVFYGLCCFQVWPMCWPGRWCASMATMLFTLALEK